MITYNQAELVGDSLESALAQEYEPLEIVVADDASTDGTVDVLRRYEERHTGRVRIVVGDRNVGVTGNCNRALAMCRGTYIAFQGGDDLLLPGKISKQVAWFEENEHGVLCGHDVEHFGSAALAGVGLHSDISPLRAESGPEPFVRMGPIFAATSVMVRRNAVPRRGFDERLPMASDWKFWIDCLSGGGQFGFVDGILARYRRHEQNVTLRHAEQCWIDVLVTLALVEAEQPAMAEACLEARARLHQAEALRHLTAGEPSPARSYLALAARESPTLKRLGWLAIAHLPARIQREVLHRRLPAGLRPIGLDATRAF